MYLEELELLEVWLEDKSFINWVNNQNDEDIIKWNLFFKENQNLLEFGEVGKQMIKGIPFVPITVDNQRKKHSLLKFEEKLDAIITDQASVKKHYHFGHYIKIAASIAAVVVLIVSLYLQSDYYNEVMLNTRFGEMASYTLPDSSQITLNANSSIKYDKRFPREVWVTGEAYFEITKKIKTGVNFKVHADETTVTVLGTSFNVDNRGAQTKVYLKEGRINLSLKELGVVEVIEMQPGDLVKYSKNDEKVIAHQNTINSKRDISWIDGSLIFKNENISAVFDKMEKIYGIKYTIKSAELLNKKITIGVPINNLNIAHEAIKTLLNATIERDQNNYFIIKER